jgi:hypothetical protein
MSVIYLETVLLSGFPFVDSLLPLRLELKSFRATEAI